MPTTEQKITVLKHLANGRDTDWVANVTKVPQDAVEQLADEAGWPDPNRLITAIEALTASTSTIPTRVDRTVVTPGSAPRSTTTTTRPDLAVARRPAPAPPAPIVAEQRTVSTSAAELIHEASGSKKVRTRNLGTKIAGLLGDLSKALRTEQEADRAAQEAAEQRARNAKRIEQLEAELARLKGHKSSPRAAAKTSAVGGVVHIAMTSCEGEGCDRTFDTIQGLNLHRRKAHGLPSLRIHDLPRTA